MLYFSLTSLFDRVLLGNAVRIYSIGNTRGVNRTRLCSQIEKIGGETREYWRQQSENIVE